MRPRDVLYLGLRGCRAFRWAGPQPNGLSRRIPARLDRGRSVGLPGVLTPGVLEAQRFVQYPPEMWPKGWPSRSMATSSRRGVLRICMDSVFAICSSEGALGSAIGEGSRTRFANPQSSRHCPNRIADYDWLGKAYFCRRVSACLAAGCRTIGMDWENNSNH